MASHTPKRDPNDPSEKSLAYEIMLPRWHKVESLLGGTETMRAAGLSYLPQHEEESDPAWQERLASATLFNMTQLILDAWVGRPFSDPVHLENMPDNILALLDDLDLQGNNLDVVARNWFREGLAKAFSHILVDFPRVATEAELGRPRTVADDNQESVRPYWVLVKPENLIFAASEIVDSREVLTHVRIHEVMTEQMGFIEKTTEKIRVYDVGFVDEDGETVPTHVTLWRKLEKPKRDKKGRKIEWEVEDEWDLGISFIPLVTFYADRNGLMEGKPPTIDIADLNITHWQSGSDQRSTLTVTRFPIFFIAGAIDADKLRIGPRSWINVPDPTAKFGYVEHTGAALDAGWKDLEKLERQMEEYGAEFLKKRPDRETAFARALDSAEATSPLQDAVNRFIDALNTALKFTAAWLNQKEFGKASVTTDFGPEEADPVDSQQLIFARTNRDLSREKYLKELQRRATLPDDFDFVENESELEAETVTIMEIDAEAAKVAEVPKDDEGDE